MEQKHARTALGNTISEKGSLWQVGTGRNDEVGVEGERECLAVACNGYL